MISQQRYSQLPETMYVRTKPDASPSPAIIELNRGLLTEYGLSSDWFHSDEGLDILAGNQVSTAPCLSLAYGGHQFGNWVPSLGDGRAHMLGQLTTSDGRSIDLQLKGSGRTPFSRGGDGRATLGSVIREYIVSEAMAGLGISTTRSLAVVTTGQPVRRDQFQPGAILVRTATSHLRIGSFQYAASNLGPEQFKEFVDTVIDSNFPDTDQHSNPYVAFFQAVADRQADLICAWMLTGFIHGVMNTDNMSIVGETIDFGPCAFLDEYHPRKVFSSIDHHGRYAWDQQPSIGLWNLTRLAETLAPLISSSTSQGSPELEQVLASFGTSIQQLFHDGFCKKLGIDTDSETLSPLVQSMLTLMASEYIDFTIFFDRLTRLAAGADEATMISLFGNSSQGKDWLQQWRDMREHAALPTETMRKANPVLIARNHRVEEAIDAATHDQNFAPFRRLCQALATPFIDLPEYQDLQTPPTPEQRVTQTFCGT